MGSTISPLVTLLTEKESGAREVVASTLSKLSEIGMSWVCVTATGLICISS
jgi:hypothetical protein